MSSSIDGKCLGNLRIEHGIGGEVGHVMNESFALVLLLMVWRTRPELNPDGVAPSFRDTSLKLHGGIAEEGDGFIEIGSVFL